MRVSREKINKLAHAVADALAEVESVDFVEDRNTIRLEVRRVLENLPPGRKLKASAAPSSKAPRSGTSSTVSTTTRK
jgi:hypothetical protein